MHSIDLNNAHSAKVPNLFALSVGGVAWFCLALFFFLVSWMVGEDDFQESIGGNYGLAGLLAGFAIGAILCAITKPNR